MELRPLRYFCSVADHGSFSHAARTLFVSQSAISEQIAGLEEELGVKLIDRSQRAIRLTPHGELFLPEARKTLAAATLAADVARRSARGQAGVLRVGFFAGGIGASFPTIIRSFRRHHPEVRVVLSEMSATEQWRALQQGDLDVAFTRKLDSANAGKLASEVVYRDAIFAVLPRTHRLAPGQVDLRDLANEPFVMCERESSPALFEKIMEICAEAGFAPRVVNTSAVWRTIVMLVQAREGIALLPPNLQHLRASDLAFCPLSTKDAFIELVMAWSPQRDTPLLQSFRRRVQAIRHRS